MITHEERAEASKPWEQPWKHDDQNSTFEKLNVTTIYRRIFAVQGGTEMGFYLHFFIFYH